MFDFSEELIQSDTDNVLKDIAQDLIFKNTLHTHDLPTKIKNGEYILLNYKGLLCFIVNNNGDPYIVLSTQYDGVGVPSIFEDMQEILKYTKNTIIKDIKFLYNTYISDRNIYILNTYNTENESTNISIIIAQLIISLYKDLKIKPVFLKNTNLIGFDWENVINYVNNNIKTLYLNLRNVRDSAFNNKLYIQLNKVINVYNSDINIITINSDRKNTKISDRNEYLDYLRASKFKGNVKGTGAISKLDPYIKNFKGVFRSNDAFNLYSYDKIIFSLTDYYLKCFQIYKVTYEEETTKKHTSTYDILYKVAINYRLSYEQVKEDIMLCYNLLCDEYYKDKVEYLYVKD